VFTPIIWIALPELLVIEGLVEQQTDISRRWFGKSNDLKSKKPIFDSGYSSRALLIMGCSGLFCAVLLFWVLAHLGRYPIAGSLLSLFLLRTMIDAKVEKIMVLEDRFVLVTRHLHPWGTKKQEFLFSAVESIHIPAGKGETFLVQYKDGDRRRLSPSIRQAQFQDLKILFTRYSAVC
jgi:hypothetical protein